MDVLSDVITSLRAGRPGVGRVAWHPPWGHRFPPAPGSAGFLVILQGPCWLIPDTGEPVALGAGDILFTPVGDSYAVADNPSTPLTDAPTEHLDEAELFASSTVGQARDGATVTLCGGYHLDPGRTHPLLRDLPPVIHVPARLGHHPELRAAVDFLGAETHSSRPGADAVVPVLLDMLLLYMLRAWLEEQPEHGTATGWAAALADPAIRAALDAVHRDPTHPWTVETLAQQARLSRATFARRFRTLTGQPPLTYLTWWRLTITAKMLRETDLSVEAVAAHAGYTSEFAFANAFKRHHGLAPGKYRRQSRTIHTGTAPAANPTSS